MADKYPKGMDLIRQGKCPAGLSMPLACWFCPVGHATECHYPQNCEEADCRHYRIQRLAETEAFIDD